MVLDRNDLIFTIETVLKAAGHVWRPEIEPPLPEVAADAVLLLISRKQPATPPASEPSREMDFDDAKNIAREWLANCINFDFEEQRVLMLAEFLIDQLAHFAGQRPSVDLRTVLAYEAGQRAERAKIAALKIALADAIRCPMGVCPDSAVGFLTVEELKDAENRRIEGKSPALKHIGLTGEAK